MSKINNTKYIKIKKLHWNFINIGTSLIPIDIWNYSLFNFQIMDCDGHKIKKS